MNKRIEKARKTLSMTRAAFGAQMGVSGDVINNLERGRVEAKEHMVMLICQTYGVNEEWLRTGEGEMFLSDEEETDLAKLTLDILTGAPNPFKIKLLKLLAEMTDAEWAVVENLAERLVKKE